MKVLAVYDHRFARGVSRLRASRPVPRLQVRVLVPHSNSLDTAARRRPHIRYFSSPGSFSIVGRFSDGYLRVRSAHTRSRCLGRGVGLFSPSFSVEMYSLELYCRHYVRCG